MHIHTHIVCHHLYIIFSILLHVQVFFMLDIYSKKKQTFAILHILHCKQDGDKSADHTCSSIQSMFLAQTHLVPATIRS